LKLVFFLLFANQLREKEDTLSRESKIRANSPQKLLQIISLKLIVAELGSIHKMGSKHGN
jgi:hypothetical protein